MAKPDGRIEKGQRLASAISARAWNRAQDAADIVLGVRPGIIAGSFNVARLPCVIGTLPDKGWFGQVRTFSSVASSNAHFVPVMPPSINSLGDAGPEEQRLIAFTLTPTRTDVATSAVSYDLESRFAVCVGNDSNDYAISGMAITRVRCTNISHRRARLPSQINHSTDADIEGSLDSAWWGPAQVVGYAEPQIVNGVAEGVKFSFPTNSMASFTNPVIYWALIAF
jgi:hypothetical protein